MSALSQPRDPLIERALADAGAWCHGHVIDARPALAHAVRVARELDEHVPGRPSLICAALLHDSPLFVPDLIDRDVYLAGCYGAEVTRIVRGMQAQHEALNSGSPPLPINDLPVLLSAAAAASALLPEVPAGGRGACPRGMATDLAKALDQIERATASCMRQS
jgi:hypothetical protein